MAAGQEQHHDRAHGGGVCRRRHPARCRPVVGDWQRREDGIRGFSRLLHQRDPGGVAQAGPRHGPRDRGHAARHRRRDPDRGAARHPRRGLPARVRRQRQVRPAGPLHGDGHDRRALDRDGAVRLRHVDPHVRLLRVRRLARACLPDAAGRDRLDRADAEARPCPPARGVVRARRDQEPHHRDGRPCPPPCPASCRVRCWLWRAPPARPRRCSSPSERRPPTTRICSTGRTPPSRRRSSSNATSSFLPAQDRAWGAALTLVLLTFLVTLVARVFTARLALKR